MQQIAFVFQQSKLFKKSIFDNVKLGNPAASNQEVMRGAFLRNASLRREFLGLI